MNKIPASLRLLAVPLFALLLAMLFSPPGAADEAVPPHQHAAPSSGSSPAPFVATSTRPFANLMDDAMNVMNDGMRRAPMNGDPDHDFASMMIPHHQGAVDMAKTVLLYGKNPVLRRLAQEIIISQSAEIAVMRVELEKTADNGTAEPIAAAKQ
jgi:hypothetical protein